MSFFNNTNNLHNKFSFNIFAICGYIILLGFLINFFQTKLLDSYALLWQISLFNVIYAIILLISVIVFIPEKVLGLTIKNSFIVNNHIICIIRYFGAFVSIIYTILAIIFLLLMLRT